MTVTQGPAPQHSAAAVFIDHWHALVGRMEGSLATVTDLTRDMETEPEFLLRVARETEDCERIVVMGPGNERLAFEREYVSLYLRPDRLLDDEAIATATRSDLLDRLRILDS